MKDLIIVGASGFGRELLAVIEDINCIEPTWNVRGFIDDNPNALDGFDTGYKVLGPIAGWKPLGDEMYALAIASPTIKEKIVPKLKENGAKFATILSPSVLIGKRSTLGEGVVMAGGVWISVDVTIGDFVFFNAQAMVGHDAVIGDYTTVSARAHITGKVVVGRCVNIGTVASIYPGITVGDYATVGMNSAVIRRVKPGTTVIGVPAKVI